MLARLILVLLLAASAVPAAAAEGCHENAATHHAMPGMPDMPDHKVVTAHVCIGCIPPGDWVGAGCVAPMMPALERAITLPARLDLNAGTPPALPPPRSA